MSTYIAKKLSYNKLTNRTVEVKLKLNWPITMNAIIIMAQKQPMKYSRLTHTVTVRQLVKE